MQLCNFVFSLLNIYKKLKSYNRNIMTFLFCSKLDYKNILSFPTHQESGRGPSFISGSSEGSDPTLEREQEVLVYTRTSRWQISSAVTTQHLMSVISVANTLMSMNHATFKPSKQPRRKTSRYCLTS